MKLYSLQRVSTKKVDIDSVKAAKQDGEYRRAMDILMQAKEYYHAMRRFREQRERNKRYVYGDQWDDMICVNGERMSEEEYLMRQGCVPLKNNLIRRLMRNVIGVFKGQSTEPTCIARDRSEQQIGETMSTLLQYNMQLNQMGEIYARSLEEFLISGMIVHKKSFGWREGQMDCWTENIEPNNFFIDTNMRDFRMWDCSFVGEIHDVDFKALAKAFSRTPKDYMKLAEMYQHAGSRGYVRRHWEDFGFGSKGYDDFLVPQDSSLCRVIEVWRKETKPRYRCHDYNTGEIFKVEIEDYEEMVVKENAARMKQGVSMGMEPEDVPLISAEWFVDDYWYYYYLSPFGDIIAEGETPYAHGAHPYVFKAYPFIDGEIHPFASDVIDQQRYTNRLITLYDMIMRASAKGVLLVPEDSLGDMTVEEFAEAWTRPNGVVVYRPSKSGHQPQQVAANSTNIGIGELLNIQLKFFEDISGVNGALQGKPGYSGTSGALYAQQTQNATTSLLDLLDTFNDFIRDCAIKDVKNIQQFYDDNRIMNIAGKRLANIYSADKIRNVEFDLSVIQSTATPAYRAFANDFLMQLWSRQAISLEQLLEVGEFPFGDELIQSLQSQKEQMAQGAQAQGLPPELVAQAQEGANMEAVAQLNEALRQ